MTLLMKVAGTATANHFSTCGFDRVRKIKGECVTKSVCVCVHVCEVCFSFMHKRTSAISNTERNEATHTKSYPKHAHLPNKLTTIALDNLAHNDTIQVRHVDGEERA